MGSSLLGPFEKEGPVRLRGMSVLHSAGALPETYDVSFGVLEVDCDDGVLDFVVAFRQPTVDGSGRCRHLSLLVNLCGSNHMVLHSRVLADIPSEGFLVEGLCAFLVVGRYLKVYDPSMMHILHRESAAEKSV